jgi:ribosomal protein S18 acetylase RimI-like enzyme
MSKSLAALNFRYATPGDTSAVALLIERAYRGPEAATGWTNEAHLLTGPRTDEREIADLIDDPESRFVLAEENGALVGCALVQKDGEDAYFGMFSVDPGVQGQGLGKKLLAACEKAAKAEWNSRALGMVVINLRGELIAWYERRGYTLTGNREPFPFDEAPGAVRRDFDLVELKKPL